MQDAYDVCIAAPARHPARPGSCSPSQPKALVSAVQSRFVELCQLRMCLQENMCVCAYVSVCLCLFCINLTRLQIEIIKYHQFWLWRYVSQLPLGGSPTSSQRWSACKSPSWQAGPPGQLVKLSVECLYIMYAYDVYVIYSSEIMQISYMVSAIWVKTILNHPFGNDLYHLSMVIWEMVSYCFDHIKWFHIPTGS